MTSDFDEYKGLYVKTIEVNLVLYLESLKKFSKKYECEEDISIMIDNIMTNDTVSLLSRFVLMEIEKYGEIFNTAVLDFDDIKILIFIVSFLENHLSEDDCKKSLLLNSLYLIKDIIMQEKMFKDYDNSSPVKSNAFIMIDKLIDRIKSNRKGFTPVSITYKELKSYYGSYGIYMLVKSSYYPFQSYSDKDYESYKSLLIAIDLLKEGIELDSESLISHLVVLEELNNSMVNTIADSLYQYGNEELRIKLKERSVNE